MKQLQIYIQILMFEKIVQKLINKILGEYVQDFNSQNLNIGIWKGQVVVQGVKLKRDLIKKFNLPFNIKYSRLGCLRMNIPWSSLSSSKIEVSVQGLQLLITQIPEQFWQCKNQKIIQLRKKQIQKFCEGIIADFTKKSDKTKQNAEKEQGYISNMIVKIIDNIQVVVKDIHIRFQDQITKKFSFGVTLQQLKIYTVNKQGQPQFIDRTKKVYQNQPLRKKLFLANLGVYWNQASQFFKTPDPHQQMIDSIYKKQRKGTKRMNYILMMSFNAMLYLRQAGKQFQQPQINLFIEFNELKVQITNNQLQQIITLGERLQKFKNQVRLQNRKKLTQLQMIANRQVFLQLFPKYFDNTATVKQLQQIQQILQKMEPQNFHEGIKKILQQKEKLKMIQQKKQKSRGWFSGPKELTQQQILQIQSFITNNFGKQANFVKRPQNFYYIKVNFNLNLLDIVIANESNNQKTKQGIRVCIIDIKMQFCLREEGYMLNFAMNNINAEIFKFKRNNNHTQEQQKMLPLSIAFQSHLPTDQERINIIQAIKTEEFAGKTRQYVRLQVFGNPLNKKGIDTEVVVRTQELLVQLHPGIIKIIKDFIDIKLSTQNSQAALQAYGQLKNIASSAANQSLKKPFQKKNFICLDMNISAISLILFFNTQKTNEDIWVLKIGNTKVYSDLQILKKTQYTYDEPMEKYGLCFQDMSFNHFESKNAYFNSRNFPVMDPKFNPNKIHKINKVLNDLDINLQLQLFKDSTLQVPKIRVKTILHGISIQLNSFIYESIQKINQCFKLPSVKYQSKISQQRQKERQKMNSKSEVMKQAQKIGILYEQSKQAKKFIAVLNGNYLYFYKDKKDIDYSEYYYLKNCNIIYNNEPLPSKKPYQVQFRNSVNTLILGFDKSQQMQQWVKAIKAISQNEQFKSLIQQKKQHQIVKKLSSKIINPDLLTAQICASIQKVSINTMFRDNKNLKISIKSLESLIKVHESKNVLDFSLQSIQLEDNIYVYKNKQLNNLLYTAPIPGRQRIIYVNIINYSTNHPKYQNIDAIINVEFGKLICNYKPETMERVMNFYIPKDSMILQKRKQKGQQLTLQQKKILQIQKKQHKKQIIENQLKKGLPQTFLLKINLKIEQISASLVNRYNKVMIARLGLTGFSFSFALSSRRMVMSGRLKEMWFADYSNYPYTIYEERQKYDKVNYIVQSYNNSRDMVSFSVQLLQIPNQEEKSMFIKVSLYDLRVSYIQQPVLRTINYLLQQILPSLTPPEDLSQSIQVPKNDTKPSKSPMVLFAQIENVLALIEPRSSQYPNQYLQLNVSKIEVRNNSFYRQFIKNRQPDQQPVLIQNYLIQMSSIKILQKFNKKQVSLTNDLNFKVNCDLIQNPMYYRKLYRNRFDAGMRIECQLSPFLFCINHVDYNFIMKCLFWNIIYDDNAEGYFSRQVIRQTTISHTPVSEPINFGLSMSKIILCVTEDNFPISILLLNQMRYDLTLDQTGMYMIFRMKHLCGTTMQKCSNDPSLSLQRGMFNSFEYKKLHKTQNLLSIPKLVETFSNNQLTKTSAYTKQQYVIIFKMCTITQKNESIINLNIKDIKIAIELKTLLTLSKLALLEPYIQPPKSQIRPIHKNRIQNQDGGNVMTIQIQMQNFLGCVGDKNLQNFFVMQGVFFINLKLYPTKSQQKIIQQSKSFQTPGKIKDISSYQIKIRKYSFYYCSSIHTLQNKRYILQPLAIFLMLRQSYYKVKQTVITQVQIDGMVDHITIQCSIRDLLVINKILQQYLQILNQMNKPSSTSSIKNQQTPSPEKQVHKKMIRQQIQQQIAEQHSPIQIKSSSIQNKIKTKTIGTIKLQPIQFRVVNDCGHNFMPVINFFIDQSCLMYNVNFIKKQISYNLGMKMDFFNPRSASWQPIIQTYQISFQYMTLVNQYGDKSKINIASSQQEQLKQLKLNISTQLILTLLATYQLAKKQSKNLSQGSKFTQGQILKIETSQISPYYLQNKTIHPITIFRTLSGLRADKQLQPQFKGQVRMDELSEVLKFGYKGRKYEVNMEKYGYVAVPNLKDVHLQFKVNKLNRIISFVDKYTIRNCTNFKLYCQRLKQNGERIQDQFIQVNPQDSIAFKEDWKAQFSFNKKTFTPPHSIRSMTRMNALQAQSSRFKFTISQKRTLQDHYVLNLRAPFIISNCLPKNIQFQFISNGKHLSTRQILAQTSHQVFANEDINNLRFKIIAEGFYWSEQFFFDPIRLGKQNQLSMNDRQFDFTLIKYIFELNQSKNQIKLSIYCPAFIISQLEEDMIIYGNLQKDQKHKAIQKYYRLGGQSEYWLKNSQLKKQQTRRCLDKVTIVGSQIGSKLRICGSNCIIDFSEPFNISSIGIHQARVVVQRQIGLKKMSVFTMLGIQIALKKMTLTSNIISKQITIRHRYIIQNKSNYFLLIKEQGSHSQSFYVQKGEKKPFYYTIPSIGAQPRNMILKTPQTKQSLPIPSNTLGLLYFRLQLKEKKHEYLYFKINTQQISSYLFYQISQVSYNDLPYQAVVKSNKIRVYVPLFEKVLTKDCDPLFFINQTTQTQFNLFILVNLIQTQQSQQVTVATDNLNFTKDIRFLNKNTSLYETFKVSITFNDNRRFIIIQQLAANQQQPQHQIQSIHVKLQKLSFSFIQNHAQIQNPYESFYFFFYNLQLISLKSNLLTRYQARLQFLQFDQDQPFNVPDPVIVTGHKFKQYMSQQKQNKAIFNALVEIDNRFVKNFFINLVKVQVNDLVVRATTYFIKIVMSLVKEYNYVFKNQNQFFIKRQLNTWKNINLSSGGSQTFIKSIQIAPFTIQITAQVRLNELDIESVVFFGTIINALGVVITNIENAPIKFDGIDITNCIDTIGGIQQKLLTHYKASVMRQLYKVFGSLNIIGNPVSLFKNISAGVRAFQEKPAQGFVKGPLQFGLGIANGTSSLIALSFGGALNSVEKVTGTLASGLAVLTFDKQFEQARQRQKMKKPKHLLQGLQKGGKAIFHGFKEGITGVVTKPIQKTKQQGFVGFLKGTAQGFTGLAIKPVTGIVDFASKTTEGLKNTTLHFEDKPNQNRIRHPRVFYTQCNVIRQYNPTDSKLLAIISKTKYEDKYGFQNPTFMCSYLINSQQFLLVLKQYIIMIQTQHQRIDWAIPLQNVFIGKSQQSERQLKIFSTNRRQWYTKKVNASVEFETKDDVQNFIKLLQQLKANISISKGEQEFD